MDGFRLNQVGIRADISLYAQLELISLHLQIYLGFYISPNANAANMHGTLVCPKECFCAANSICGDSLTETIPAAWQLEGELDAEQSMASNVQHAHAIRQ